MLRLQLILMSTVIGLLALSVLVLTLTGGNAAVIALAAAATVLALLFTCERYINYRKTVMAGELTMQTQITHQAMAMDDYMAVAYNLEKETFSNRFGEFLADGMMTLRQFQERVNIDDRRELFAAVERIRACEEETIHLKFRWNAATITQPRWRIFEADLVREADTNGHTRAVTFILADVTERTERQQVFAELGQKYFKLFDSTLIAMSFYDADGHLLDLNENMRQLCQLTPEIEYFYRTSSFYDLPVFRQDFDPKSRNFFHVCHHQFSPDGSIENYVEVRVLPVYDGDTLRYYIMTARDCTEERNLYLNQRRRLQELEESNKVVNTYEEELNYLLENSEMWVWKSDLSTRTVSFTRSLRDTGFTQTFDEWVDSLDPDGSDDAIRMMGELKGEDTTFNGIIHFRKSLMENQPMWCMVSGIPLHDSAGHLTGHFGVVRDITTLMETQEHLRRETARAEDSGRMKSTFLANMTHEIRTPLNSIVGFSDLLQAIDNTEDRREFIRIIRNNCDMLLRLINDIIEASTMNQRPLAITPTDVDFAKVFTDICQTLSHRVQEPGIDFIVDNPCSTIPTRLDAGRVQQVVTNFVTNAIKYTHKGHIKVGYRLIGSATEVDPKAAIASQTPAQPAAGPIALFVYCEDSGAGIPKEKQASVFDRFVKLNDFVQGTGLGLSISKTIAERCNGTIGLTSEGEGHGCTFWFAIPIEVSSDAAS